MRKLLSLVFLLCLLAGCGARRQTEELPEEERRIVGQWRMTETADLQEQTVTEVGELGFTLTLREDRTGTLQIAQNAFSLRWSYDKTDERGNDRYRADLDGAEAYLFYMCEYGQLWLQNGAVTYMFER